MVRHDMPHERGVQALMRDNLTSEEEAGRLADSYRRAYGRGWAASRRGSSLEAADHRGEPDAWYDGYHDQAADRPRWHLAWCRPTLGVHDGTGGCLL